MSRYLIIDTEIEEEWIETTFSSAFKGTILTEEESLAKFKEIYDEGCDQDYAGNNWAEFKKKHYEY